MNGFDSAKYFGPRFHSKYSLKTKTKLPLISRSQHFQLWENVAKNLIYVYIKIISVSSFRSCTVCVDFQSWTLSKSKYPLINDIHLFTLISLCYHSGGINGIATIQSKDKVNEDITVLCSDDTCRELYTYISTLTTQQGTYLVSQRAGKHAGDSQCIMVQGKTKFTKNCILPGDITYLLTRDGDCENISKERKNSEQLIRPPNFLELYLEKWF